MEGDPYPEPVGPGWKYLVSISPGLGAEER